AALARIRHAYLFRANAEAPEQPASSLRRSVIVLGVSAGLVGLESEWLVTSLSPALTTLHLPAIFVGLIVIPIIGNASEHASAVFFAARDRLDLTLEIAVGSSTQIALFVAPILVFVSLAIGHPMDFVFTAFEIAVVSLATLIVALISLEGRSNWLSGVQLVGAYAVIVATATATGPVLSPIPLMRSARPAASASLFAAATASIRKRRPFSSGSSKSRAGSISWSTTRLRTAPTWAHARTPCSGTCPSTSG